jgi:hypothetical protein
LREIPGVQSGNSTIEVFSTNCLRFGVPPLGDPRALSDQQSTRLLVSGHRSPGDFAEFKAW